MRSILFFLTIAILYQTALAQENYHPADTNQDWRISGPEFDAYNNSWRNKVNWPVGPNPIPMDYVTRAGFLLKTGEKYKYDETKKETFIWQPDIFTTCKAILDAGESHGDGVYFIDPDGNDGYDPFYVYCDMTIDGGGWTLVLQQTTNGTNAQIKSGESNSDQCLLTLEEDCTSPRFHNKNTIVGTSYMKKIGDSKFFVVKFSNEKTWWKMSVRGLPEYTYYADNPSTTYKGYSKDVASASGCQDWATYSWSDSSYGRFAHADGNSACKGNEIFISNSVHTGNKTGACYKGNYKYGFVYVR